MKNVICLEDVSFLSHYLMYLIFRVSKALIEWWKNNFLTTLDLFLCNIKIFSIWGARSCASEICRKISIIWTNLNALLIISGQIKAVGKHSSTRENLECQISLTPLASVTVKKIYRLIIFDQKMIVWKSLVSYFKSFT